MHPIRVRVPMAVLSMLLCSAVPAQRSLGGFLKCMAEETFNLTIATLNIAAYSALDVTGKGSAGGYPDRVYRAPDQATTASGYGQGPGGGGWFPRQPWASSWWWYAGSGSGGGYGGQGGYGYPYEGRGPTTWGTRGGTYGSAEQPIHFGSGGGGGFDNTPFMSDWGGAGGGAIRLEVRNLTVTGSVIADGGRGLYWACHSGSDDPGNYGTGGGSGGSIWITAKNLMDAGLVRANGGNGAYGQYGSGKGSGGGGGGRVAVYYNDMSEFAGSIPTPQGGTSYRTPVSTAGTVYFEYVPPAGTFLLLF